MGVFCRFVELRGGVSMNKWELVVHRMKKAGVFFNPGLTDAEVVAVEARFGFRFPPDLRAFLQTALPRGRNFPDWRAGSDADLRERLDRPLQGILFDVQYGGYWLEEWGSRPSTLEDAQQVLCTLIEAAPRLIPVYMHRMMPDEPHLPGNPIFSVHQADIVRFGPDLEEYLCREFGLRRTIEPPRQGQPRRRGWYRFRNRVHTAAFSNPERWRAIRFWNIERFQEARWGNGVRPPPWNGPVERGPERKPRRFIMRRRPSWWFRFHAPPFIYW